jgi:hypothetical protein
MKNHRTPKKTATEFAKDQQIAQLKQMIALKDEEIRKVGNIMFEAENAHSDLHRKDKQENEKLTKKNTLIKKMINELSQKNQSLQNELREQATENTQLKAQIDELKLKNVELLKPQIIGMINYYFYLVFIQINQEQSSSKWM